MRKELKDAALYTSGATLTGLFAVASAIDGNTLGTVISVGVTSLNAYFAYSNTVKGMTETMREMRAENLQEAQQETSQPFRATRKNAGLPRRG